VSEGERERGREEGRKKEREKRGGREQYLGHCCKGTKNLLYLT